ncbi:hypothetical protein LTR95_016481 [Oleoguttula sp. CCFEE 5521]
MADLPAHLLRLVARCFYPVDHILVIEALLTHSTLSDTDLTHVLGYSNNTKVLRRLCGRLKDDGLLSIQQRTERRTDGSGGAFYDARAGVDGKGGMKERVMHRDWYYLNYHHAIDSIKFRMHKTNKHVESMGAPATEKKELSCKVCKSQYTELEAMDTITELGFKCSRCGNILDVVPEEERASENETTKRFNQQMEPIQKLLQEIDQTTVPENNFDEALAKQKAITRTDANPAARTEIIDNPNRNLQSTKGLALKPEKISVSVQDDETVKQEERAAEARARREKEARQNALPEWISKSTITGDVTAVGAKEARERAAREAHAGVDDGDLAMTNGADEKKAENRDEEVMNAYWAELAAQQQKEMAAKAAQDDEEEEDEDDDEDEFEDVDVGGSTVATAPATNGIKRAADEAETQANGDERDAKRVRTNSDGATNGANGALPSHLALPQVSTPIPEATPAASDEDEDDLEFENV